MRKCAQCGQNFEEIPRNPLLLPNSSVWLLICSEGPQTATLVVSFERFALVYLFYAYQYSNLFCRDVKAIRCLLHSCPSKSPWFVRWVHILLYVESPPILLVTCFLMHLLPISTNLLSFHSPACSSQFTEKVEGNFLVWQFSDNYFWYVIVLTFSCTKTKTTYARANVLHCQRKKKPIPTA